MKPVVRLIPGGKPKNSERATGFAQQLNSVCVVNVQGGVDCLQHESVSNRETLIRWFCRKLIAVSGGSLFEMRQTSETSKIRRWTHRGRQRSSGHLLDDCSRIANWRPEDGSAVRAYFRSSLGGWLGRSTGQLSHVDRRISHEVARNDVTSVLSRLC